MPRETIKQVLIRRDKMTVEDADDLIRQAKQDFNSRIENGESYFEMEDFCNEWFGLEPDWLDELIY